MIYVQYDESGTVGEAILVKFREEGVMPGESTGTLHWGDNSATRVRDGSTFRHVYKSSGIYQIALQTDLGSKIVVAQVTIEDAITIVAESQSGDGIEFVRSFNITQGNFSYEAILRTDGQYRVNLKRNSNGRFWTGLISGDGTNGTLTARCGGNNRTVRINTNQTNASQVRLVGGLPNATLTIPGRLGLSC